jgi:transglutaminase-like putative cysteine protease
MGTMQDAVARVRRAPARAILAAVSVAVAAVGATLAAPSEEPASTEPWTDAFALAAQRPAGMAYDGTRLWLVDRAVPEIVALDPETGAVTDRLPSPGPWPEGLAWDGSRLWVADSEEKKIYGVDPRTKLVDRRFDSPVDAPQGLAWDGAHLWLADGSKIHNISTEDGTTITSFPAPSAGGDRGTEMLGLAWEAVGRRAGSGYLWIADRHKDKVYRVSPDGGVIVDMFPSAGPYPVGAAIVEGRLLVADRDRRKVHAIVLDGIPTVVRTEPRREDIVFVHELVNFGPGTVRSGDVYLAVPVEAPNQTFAGEPAFDPEPAEILTDRWGQKVARFHGEDIAPGQKLRATMKITMTAWAVRWHVDPERVGRLSAVPGDVRARYTADGTKYMTGDPVIEDAAEAAVGDERNPYFMVRRIARYIQDRMTYELAGGWNVAPAVLTRGTGSCSEYTFVFVAMCRAAGIPARYVGSVVVRTDDASTDNVFHRWPEVYYPGYGWVLADAQAGDSPSPEKQADAMMGLPNRFLVTTQGGGGSEYLDWNYNSNAHYSCDGYCKVVERVWGDWAPDREEQGVESTAAGE